MCSRLRQERLQVRQFYFIQYLYEFRTYNNQSIYILYSLFNRTPELLQYFEWIAKDLHDVVLEEATTEQLRTNIVLQRHATKIIRTIDLMVASIDNPEKLILIAESAACKHAKNRELGFTGDKFRVRLINICAIVKLLSTVFYSMVKGALRFYEGNALKVTLAPFPHLVFGNYQYDNRHFSGAGDRGASGGYNASHSRPSLQR